MTWQQRIYRARYIAPTGATFEFDTEDVSRTTEKRTSAFQFPGVNNEYVQDNGYGSRKYPLRCCFWGDNCDKDATRFEAALLEFGVGRLEHPLYGTFSVVPFGTIARRDDLVTAANQAIVEVEFWTTTGVAYPTAERAPKNAVTQAADGYDTEAPKRYAKTMELRSKLKQAELRGTIEAQLAMANSYLAIPSTASTAVIQEFRAWQLTINRSINTLVGNPVLLAQQLNNMIRAPARAVIGIQNRLVAYADFLRSLSESGPGRPSEAHAASVSEDAQIRIANDWRTTDLNALNAIVAMAIAATESEYRTRPEAISVADALLSELDNLGAWREAQYAAFTNASLGARIEVVDDGVAWQAASQTVYLCVGYLLALAGTLSPERILILDRPRTILNVSAELYGAVDDETLNFLIDSNQLTGSQLLELGRGTKILWYPR